jgi:hypothetical protein
MTTLNAKLLIFSLNQTNPKLLRGGVSQYRPEPTFLGSQAANWATHFDARSALGPRRAYTKPPKEIQQNARTWASTDDKAGDEGVVVLEPSRRDGEASRARDGEDDVDAHARARGKH